MKHTKYNNSVCVGLMISSSIICLGNLRNRSAQFTVTDFEGEKLSLTGERFLDTHSLNVCSVGHECFFLLS